ncbi:MAG: hypothetical protein KGO96_00865 [Elusimicrobia bacterium]|nr:hypothetical protein [Elusimicrobiota bacterium]MDE2236548.1 hypothetical protein [Elusimicrobiota bacterium]MDE2424446.1 hypothetical protein [Elusimicrobiota bacterium]
MAPEYHVVLAALRTAAAAQQDSALAEKAASFLAPGLPEKTQAQVVEELLARMRVEKAQRDALGLNHWEEHGPEFLARLITAGHAAQRRADLAAFIAEHHDNALDFVLRITRDPDAAEAALGRTYVEVLEGKTPLRFFYRALKLNARDELRKRRLQHRRFESLDGLRGRRFTFSGSAEEGDLRAEVAPEDFASPHGDDRDPLEILAEKEELELAKRIAKSERRYRWIKQKNWGQCLRLGA